MRRLLLISNSVSHGSGYLDHCADEIVEFLSETGTKGDRSDKVERILFVPYAADDWSSYAERARQRFHDMGLALDSIHEAERPAQAVRQAQAFFVGGGNTFRLLERLYQLELLAPLRGAVATGVPYVGASAGSNVATPNIRTTNDMPIVEPPSFDALGLVPFNLNPHYIDADPESTHQGETREERIAEFLEENDQVVIGLREGGILRIEGDTMTLKGSAGARIFRRGAEPEEVTVGARLDDLLRRQEPPDLQDDQD